jgi:hypothetical protein
VPFLGSGLDRAGPRCPDQANGVVRIVSKLHQQARSDHPGSPKAALAVDHDVEAAAQARAQSCACFLALLL